MNVLEIVLLVLSVILLIMILFDKKRIKELGEETKNLNAKNGRLQSEISDSKKQNENYRERVFDLERQLIRMQSDKEIQTIARDYSDRKTQSYQQEVQRAKNKVPETRVKTSAEIAMAKIDEYAMMIPSIFHDSETYEKSNSPSWENHHSTHENQKVDNSFSLMDGRSYDEPVYTPSKTYESPSYESTRNDDYVRTSPSFDPSPSYDSGSGSTSDGGGGGYD